MKLRSCPQSAEDESVLITEEPLSPEKALSLVQCPGHGAVAIFLGFVRDTENDVPIESIFYESYQEMAIREIEKIVGTAKKKWNVKMVIHHRTQSVPVGESSLIVACSGIHRPETFEACQYAVDEIKKNVPIWKAGFSR